MNHQGELEKNKYRNWVRGGLAYKYLKEGLEGFADDVVDQEHTRILSAISQTPGLTCNQCCLRNLRPIHKCERDPVTGGNKCYWGQSNCNCLYPKKRPCHFKVCDRILEDILKCHGSTPPTPNWKNTDTQKWCTDPWEIAKCFINAPGYSDKTKAADIDTPGLLHVFINNINLQSRFSDNINRSDTFRKILQRRNELFHSATMELEGTKLDEYIDDIIAILEDEKELKSRNDAQQAVFKLKQLKQKCFIITTHDEVEVCRDALVSVTKKSEELKQTIRDGKDDIVRKQKEATGAIDDAKEYIGKKRIEVTDAIQEAKCDIDKKQTEVVGAIQGAKENIHKKQIEAVGAIKDAKDDISKKRSEAVDAIQCAKNDISKKQKEAIDAIEDAKTDISQKQKEATEAVTNITQKALQDVLQEIDRHSLYLRVGRLELDSSTSNQRLALLESKVDILDNVRHNHQKQLDYVERKQELQKQLVTMYQDHYVKTAISPLKSQDNNLNVTEIYVSPKMVVEDNVSKSGSQTTEKPLKKPKTRIIHTYREILQTNDLKHKKIYIVGDVGTGKSTFCKMMIQNWCSAVTADNRTTNKSENSRRSDFRYENNDDKFLAVNRCSLVDCCENAVSEKYVEPIIEKNYAPVSKKDESSISDNGESSVSDSDESYLSSNDECSLSDSESTSFSDIDEDFFRKIHIEYEYENECFDVSYENINEMKQFDFLFFVPLQRMSGIGDITEMVKAIVTAADLASADLIDRIFEQESARCLVVAEGLDEWTPPKGASVLQHVSFGLPNRAKAHHAVIVTLSRASAKGLLNIKSSEYDQKVELLGINEKSMTNFIKKYLSKFHNTDLSYDAFMEKTKTAKLEHLERTPLLLQQLVWLYCTGNDTGKSVSDTYCHIVNIMLGWSQKREEDKDMDGDQIGVTKQDDHMQLPGLLQKFPRCEANKRFLLPLARVAFEALTSETGSSTLGRSHLQQRGVPKEDIITLIRFGILVENNRFDPTKENTQIEFIHISYLEVFAAVYVSSHYNENQRSKLLKTILQDLFQNCKSAADVLQLSNVLRLICGLSPFLLPELSKSISDIVNEDESIIRFRNSMLKFGSFCYISVTRPIHGLILGCLSECDTDDQSMFTLCDIIITSATEKSFLQRIIPDNVVSVYVFSISDVEVCRWIARLKGLQYLYFSFSRLPHSEMELVYSFIQEAPLKYLALISVRCNCYNHDHGINLSNNDQLQKLELGYGTRVMIPNTNTKQLEMLRFVSISQPDFEFLRHARNLTELHIELSLHVLDKYHFDKEMDSVLHTLQKLRRLKLEKIRISDSALIVSPEMRNLKHIDLQDVRMSLQTWCRFVDRLLTLQQSVHVVRTAVRTDERDYVRTNTRMYKVIEDGPIRFKFRTKK
ncbi:uncharacterized protein LOC123548696 [Mercenaria mercenaria]|uniref:uncharacterized protein LOC123548696 n=1 Tax=Mercenaria mercenaria TaxID=6596 RepID=UPI00234ECE8A|nr:uncharacterized protein LOC123548696 [Mercenaria mercenaria]